MIFQQKALLSLI